MPRSLPWVACLQHSQARSGLLLCCEIAVGCSAGSRLWGLAPPVRGRDKSQHMGACSQPKAASTMPRTGRTGRKRGLSAGKLGLCRSSALRNWLGDKGLLCANCLRS